MTTYECAGRGESGDGCSARLENDDPDLCGTGWALLHGIRVEESAYAPLGLAMCPTCVDRSAKAARAAKAQRRRELRAQRAAGRSSVAAMVRRARERRGDGE